MKIFLGGTCNGSKWRGKLMPLLDEIGIDYFNPVVEDWNEESQREEYRQRVECDIVLYTITPKMKGVFSIAEIVDDVHTRESGGVIMVILDQDGNERFNEQQRHSLEAVAKMVILRGATVFDSIADLYIYLKVLKNLVDIKRNTNEKYY